MFDYHMHTRVSYDSETDPKDMVQAAVKAGLKEICFTDHLDYGPSWDGVTKLTFETADYNANYDNLTAPEGLLIRRGFEFGMTPDNQEDLKRDLARRPFDFVIGSVHFVDGFDPYFEPFWQNQSAETACKRYLETTLECVKAHSDFDVLGHLTYISKCAANPNPPIQYEDFPDLIDEILKTLVKKGKGMEINTSGLDSRGVFLPDEIMLRRFKELGGKIITVGSDAHTPDRVGQHMDKALALAKELFGGVYTFAERKPIFHQL